MYPQFIRYKLIDTKENFFMLNQKMLIANCKNRKVINIVKKHYDPDFFKAVKKYAAEHNFNDWDISAGFPLFADNGYMILKLSNTETDECETREIIFTGRVWLGGF